MSEEKVEKTEQDNTQTENSKTEGSSKETQKSAQETFYGDDKKSEEKSKEEESKEEESKEKESKEEESKEEESKEEESKEEKEKKEEKDDNKEDFSDIKLSEDSLISQERLDEIVSYAKEQGLSKDVAKKMIERENEAVTQYRDNATKQLNKLVEIDWPKQAKEDKEIGGEKFKESVELAKRAFNKFGSESFRKILNETGYGNHPEIIRTFSRIGRIMSDDNIVFGGQKTKTNKSAAEIFYGGGDNKGDK